MQQATIAAILAEAITELNRQLPAESRLQSQDSETILVGEGGVLDSLSLITLFVAVEEQLQEQLDLSLSLLDAMADEGNMAHFHTLGRLTQWLVEQA
ncbi:hypothetical protein Mmc1_0149 [Magnetococcus marinus MC-1]|uniref:Carrier domain-containing protein n=1 Tax=Magnetococcus marinus (strain ATCC BAA-1437 / JCM 17883 / MC-1) TaxID=156889 RepID=A0L3Y3_MAGMM|nr:hypothetical protein [Magnetococcus marinus]ABK42676.1 hypothetical protein Mmc1_0149 [Magnetococcus marinus MC-1]